MLNCNVNIIGINQGLKLVEQYEAVLDRGSDLGFLLPTQEQRVIASARIGQLIDQDLWFGIQDLWMPDSGGDADFACLNYRHPELRPIVRVNSPEYIDGMGFKGDGVSSYLSLPHATTLFTSTSSSLFFHIGNNINSGTAATPAKRDAANRYVGIRPRWNSNKSMWMYDHLTNHFSVSGGDFAGTSNGIHHAQRHGNTIAYWMEGVLLGSKIKAVEASSIPGNMFAGAANHAGSAQGFTTHIWRKLGFGDSLLDKEQQLSSILSS